MPTRTPARDDQARRRELTEELLAVVRRIHARGWCVGTAGNFSACLDRDPLRLLVTPSGCDKGLLSAEDLVLVDGEGGPVAGERGRPSAETALHCAVAACTGAGAVLHTHSVAATLLGEHCLEAGGLAITGYEMLKGLTGVETHRAREWVPVLANEQEMSRLRPRVERTLGEHPAAHGFLLAGHGLYTWGSTAAEAHRHVEIFEFLFECLARRVRFAAYPDEG